MAVSSGTINGVLNAKIDKEGFHRLGIKLDTGVFSQTGANGFDLSDSNPGYVSLQSKINPGQIVNIVKTQNSSFTDASGTSDIIGNLFGFTTGVAITVDVPFFIYEVLNDAEDASQTMICRVPGLKFSPSSGSIGTPSSAVANTNGSFFSFDDITTTEYDANPCLMIGSFSMRMDASDDWTVQSLDYDYDGVGNFQEMKRFDMPLGQFGANSGTITLDNGGTAPVFTTNNANYKLTRDGWCYYRFNLSGDGGTDGSGGVEARVVVPFVVPDTSAIVTNFPGLYNAAGGNVNLMVGFAAAAAGTQLRFRGDGLALVLTWSLFTNGSRSLNATCFYPLFPS